MPEITIDEAMFLLQKWGKERPEEAKFPRVKGNPYGDNIVGLAFDVGWWTCLKEAKERGWATPPAAGDTEG